MDPAIRPAKMGDTNHDKKMDPRPYFPLNQIRPFRQQNLVRVRMNERMKEKREKERETGSPTLRRFHERKSHNTAHNGMGCGNGQPKV